MARGAAHTVWVGHSIIEHVHHPLVMPPKMLGACAHVDVWDVGLAGGVHHRHLVHDLSTELLRMTVDLVPDGLHMGLLSVRLISIHTVCSPI